MKKFISTMIAAAMMCTAMPSAVMQIEKKAEASVLPSTSTVVSKCGRADGFTVSAENVENGNTVILALYNGDELADVQSESYTGEDILFTSRAEYDDARVMVWDSFNTMKPVCAVEEVEVVKTPVTVKVMPLGDSITDGFTVKGGYRKTLESKIQAAGISANVDFVGSDKGDNGTYDGDHEGHSGWAIEAIPASGDIEGKGRSGLAANIDSWMTTYSPDVVMLMIGTNDILSQYDLGNAPTRLSKLVDKVLAKLPEYGTVYIATIPYLKAGGNYDKTGKSQTELNAQVDAYNEGVRKIAEEKGLVLVDVNSALTISDLSDVAHPTSGGYATLGGLWYDTIIDELKDRIN